MAVIGIGPSMAVFLCPCFVGYGTDEGLNCGGQPLVRHNPAFAGKLQAWDAPISVKAQDFAAGKV